MGPCLLSLKSSVRSGSMMNWRMAARIGCETSCTVLCCAVLHCSIIYDGT
jgi:hypothetical protein